MNNNVIKTGALLFLFLISCNKIQGDTVSNEDTRARENLQLYRWKLPIGNWAYIKFLDNTYWLGSFGEGGEPFCQGFYEIKGNKIIVRYPFEIIDWIYEYKISKEILNWMFTNETDTVFTYDMDYMDFDVTSCLRNGDKILKNSALKSPFGNEYILDGVNVIKYNERENHIIVLDNLRMREKPSVNSRPVNLSVYIVGLGKKYSGNLLYKNSINSFDAVTVKEDTIDGITAPWYRVCVILDEVEAKDVWVFGGYIKRIPEIDYKNNTAQYYRNYYNTLLELNIIKDD